MKFIARCDRRNGDIEGVLLLLDESEFAALHRLTSVLSVPLTEELVDSFLFAKQIAAEIADATGMRLVPKTPAAPYAPDPINGCGLGVACHKETCGTGGVFCSTCRPQGPR